MPQANIPSEEEVLSYFDKFSNWGRWGEDDELGAPNLITPAKVKQAIATVQEGVRVSLSRTVSFEASADAPTPPVHFMVESGEGWASGDKVSNRAFPAATDYFGMIFHGHTVTHVDSLAHFFWNGKTTTASQPTSSPPALAPPSALSRRPRRVSSPAPFSSMFP